MKNQKRTAPKLNRKLRLPMLALAALLPLAQAHANLVVNGSFEDGYSGFSSAYSRNDSSLWNAGTYAVGPNPSYFHGDFAPIAAQDGTNMMVVNGAPDLNTNVWRETGISVAQNTTYYFSTWVASVVGGSPANLSFSINGSSLGTLTATTDGQWKQFYAVWNSGSSTVVNLSLVNLNTAEGGNDFALDNVAFDTTAPAAAVPEPGSLALAGLGLAGLMAARRRRRG